MRIIQFEDFFHPDAGYNINILSKYLSKIGHEVIIYTSEIDKTPNHLKTFFDCSDIEEKDLRFEDRYRVKIYRIKTYLFYSSRAIVSLKLFKKMIDMKPDIVYIHGNDTYVGILSSLYFKDKKIPIIYDSSMVEMASKNKFRQIFRFLYKTLITPIIADKKFKVIRTQDDNYVQKHLGIPLTLSPYISLGVDTELFAPIIDKSGLRETLNIPVESFVIIYAGKLDYTKGIGTLMSAWKDKLPDELQITLLLIGNVNPEVDLDFKSFIKTNKNSIVHLPTFGYSELAKYYNISNLAIFPRQISLSFFNAQACGLPVIAEENNINNERLSHGNGFTFKYGDSDDFLNKVLTMIKMSEFEYKKMSQNSINFIKSAYDYNILLNSYICIFNDEIHRLR